MAYDYAQTFFIDKNAVKGSPQVNISAVTLYFKKKPNPGTTSKPNASGILEPGVNLFFCRCNADGVPEFDNPIEIGRAEYNEIVASVDAEGGTTFTFDNEVYCETDKIYAVVTRFDGGEDFELWTNKKGMPYLGTTTISPGATDSAIKNLYRFDTRNTSKSSSSDAGGTGTGSAGPVKTSSPPTYQIVGDEDIKFSLYVARYRSTNSAVGATNSAISYGITNLNYDYLLYDRKHTPTGIKVLRGERMFQKRPYHNFNGVPDTVSILQGNTTIKSNGVDFTTIFNTATSNDNHIVVVSEGQDPGHASGINDLFFVGKVLSVATNYIMVEKYPTFSNSVANFMVAPVAAVDLNDAAVSFNNRVHGDWWSNTTADPPSWYYGNRRRQDFLSLVDSSANSSVRFVNGAIESITIVAGGTGYNNADYIVVSSTTVNSTSAYANLKTNSTGGIISTFITDMGSGHRDAPTYVVRANSTTLSSGSSANLTFVEGPSLISEYNKYAAKDLEVISFEVDTVTPLLQVNNPSGIDYSVFHQSPFYSNTTSTLVANPDPVGTKIMVKNGEKNPLEYKKIYGWKPLLTSRSHSVVTTPSNSAVVSVQAVSNGDFINPCPTSVTLLHNKNIINNDYTGEETSFGNALAKHISKKVTFESGRMAQDLMVFARAYRPGGTDVKIYGKMYNSADPEAFDDKDWTLLDCISGANTYSSATDSDDVIEYTFNVPQYPNTYYTSPGTITMYSNGQIVGTGTSFTSELQGFKQGDMVRVYSSVQPDNHMITTIDSVSSDTVMYIVDPTSNASLLTSNQIDRVQYPHQAFRNITNDNVSRYYNTSMHSFDGFDTFAIKAVLLADSPDVVPQIEDIRAIGVSA